MKKHIFLSLLLIGVFVLAACQPQTVEVEKEVEVTREVEVEVEVEVTAVPPPEPINITFQAGYLFQGNISMVAAYVAQEKGYFTEQGLDVEMAFTSPGGGENRQRLVAKDIEFTTWAASSFADVMSEDPELPFVSVVMFGQDGDLSLMVLEDSGIQAMTDLVGKTVGFKGGGEPAWLLAMLVQSGLTLDDVEMVSVGYDPRVLLPEFGAGQVDALQGYKANEPDTLTRLGYPVRVFRPEDYGVPLMGQMYVTHKDLVRDNPEIVQAFVRATMKALEYILDPANAEEVTDYVMIFAGEDRDRDHEQFMWQTEIESVTSPSTDAVGLGYATDEQWQAMMDIMVEYEAIETAVPVDVLWDPQFVEAIYDENGLIWPG